MPKVIAVELTDHAPEVLEAMKQQVLAGLAAIIKNTDNGLQYLEMQSGMKNGWKPFERTFKYEFLGREVTEKYDVASTLHSRFGCTKTTSGMYTLVDVDSFQNTEEFRDVLGYINTDPSMQKKGAGGGIK